MGHANSSTDATGQTVNCNQFCPGYTKYPLHPLAGLLSAVWVGGVAHSRSGQHCFPGYKKLPKNRAPSIREGRSIRHQICPWIDIFRQKIPTVDLRMLPRNPYEQEAELKLKEFSFKLYWRDLTCCTHLAYSMTSIDTFNSIQFDYSLSTNSKKVFYVKRV